MTKLVCHCLRRKENCLCRGTGGKGNKSRYESAPVCCVYMLRCLYDGKPMLCVFLLCAHMCHVVITGNVWEYVYFFDAISICVCLDARIAFVNVMDVYSVSSPCTSGSFLPPRQQSEQGLVSVYLFSLSLYSLFLSRREICGGWVGTGGKYKKEKQGKWLHLEAIKDVSSVLCLVCSHKSTVNGLDPGTQQHP